MEIIFIFAIYLIIGLVIAKIATNIFNFPNDDMSDTFMNGLLGLWSMFVWPLFIIIVGLGWLLSYRKGK